MARKNSVTIQARRRLFFLRPICLFLVIFVVITFASNSYRLYQLVNEKKEKENNYIELQEESEHLKNEITKLNNPEYLARYARENYAYSKDGEIVIKIDNKNEKKVENQEIATDVKSSKFDLKHYSFFGIILFVLYVFIYFVRKRKIVQ